MIAVEGLRKVAVVVRTHVVGEKLAELLKALSGSALFDLFVLANETDGPLDVRPYTKISYSVDLFEELGFGRRDQYFMVHCSDLVFTPILRAAPGYDHYLLIEYDVHLPRGNSAFVDMVVRALSSPAYADVDLAGVALRGSNPKWMWHAASAAFFPRAWAIFFPILSLTPRAIEHCYARRLDEMQVKGDRPACATPAAEEWIFCETFAPSAMLERDFRMVDLAHMFPRSYVWSAFNEGPARLLGATEVDDPTLELIHPVVEAAPFLDKRLHWSRHHRKLPDFLRDLRDGRWPLPPELADEYTQRLEAEVAALSEAERAPQPLPAA